MERKCQPDRGSCDPVNSLLPDTGPYHPFPQLSPKPSFWLYSLPSTGENSNHYLHPAFRNLSSCHSHFPFIAAFLEVPNFNPYLPLPSQLTLGWFLVPPHPSTGSVFTKVASAPHPTVSTGHFFIMILLDFCNLHTHGHTYLGTYNTNFPGFPLTFLASHSHSPLWIPPPLPFVKINLLPDLGSLLTCPLLSLCNINTEVILIHPLALTYHLYSGDSQNFIFSPDPSPETQMHRSHCLLDFLGVLKTLKQYIQN